MLAWYVNVCITQSVSIVFLAGFAFFSVKRILWHFSHVAFLAVLQL